MIIRPLLDSDLPAFHALLQHWDDYTPPTVDEVRKHVERARKNMTGEVFVAVGAAMSDEAEEALLGYAQVGEHTMVGLDAALEVIALLVRTDLRGKGVGSALMRHCQSWARDRGYACTMLSSQVHRSDAHRLYKELGYRELKRSVFFRKDC